jgi:hypothetical protein
MERAASRESIKAVNPAGLRGQLRGLPQEIYTVSVRTEGVARRPERGAEVSRRRSRPGHRLKA